eukprot:CAMPEP_0196784072 /NCGR_PEP_ID=MMETSP1104-20130614/15890_1 /TAXON_ID=33652 /ORGANISM="Cafeteria sp., Strain Caron Lab Isolate" /LENGTH=159 /DNA_ID=CAMNT_0042154343 /DNA_START=9 /DNA_END=484 /DNA_ORIENTATION=+
MPVTHQLASVSPSGSLRAVVSEVKDEAGGKGSSRIDIFSGARRVDSINLKDVHGPVYTNDYLQHLCWSSDERLLLYVAEKKRPSAKPFWEAEDKILDAERGVEAAEGEADADLFRHLGTARRMREDWGELLTGHSDHSVFALALASADVPATRRVALVT